MKSDREKAMRALLHGHGCANQLKSRLCDPKAEDGSVSSEDLARTVVACFSDALSVLIESNSVVDGDESYNDHEFTSQYPLHHHQPSFSMTRKMSKEDESKEYHRDDSPVPIYHDGFLWRKYGQKQIKASQCQRSYYRCAYGTEQQCRARKHVEMIKDNPPVFRTTYLGRHTCHVDHHQAAAFSLASDYTDQHEGAHMIQFGKLNQESNHSWVNNLDQQVIKLEDRVEYQFKHTKEEKESTDIEWHAKQLYDDEFMMEDGMWALSPGGDRAFGSPITFAADIWWDQF